VIEPVKLRGVEEIKGIARHLVEFRHGVLADQAVAAAAAALGDIVQYLETLKEAQRRGSELQDEVRGLRRTLRLRIDCCEYPSLPVTDSMFENLADLVKRRFRGDCRYGNVEAHLALPDGTGTADARAHVLIAKAERQIATQQGRLTWSHYLEEEHAEAQAESDEERLADELLDLACVAMKHREALLLRREARASLAGEKP